MNEPLLEILDLHTRFKTDDGMVTAVDGIDISVSKGESLGIVGESGCGKSVTSMSIMRLLKSPPAKIDGKILFQGKDLLTMPMDEMRKIRGNEVAMIFQEPMTSLNPIFTCGRQISEAIRLHQGLSKAESHKKAIEMLRLVGISLPEKRVNEYPHQLSGGMRQRVMIAIALSCHPKLLIADEPTTALDVTIQAQILSLIKDLRNELGMALMLITHDLGVVADMTKRVIVMYAGQVVEEADVHSLFKKPLHPYTIGLLNSIPKMDQKAEELKIIPGVVPHPLEMPKGCRFSPRCEHAMDICRQKCPELIKIDDGISVRCWLRDKGVTH